VNADPTAISMERDPRQQRFRGTAYHPEPHGTPFDVPYVSHIAGNLWTGGCASGLVLPAEIEHVVNVAPWWAYSSGGRALRSYLQVQLHDSLDQALDQVGPVARWARACCADAPTLIHCQAGLNRSALVAACVLVLQGHSAQAAVARLRAARSPAVLCNPAFEAWLLAPGLMQHLL
jgi:Dual specificity phosphatase, catalytic domain